MMYNGNLNITEANSLLNAQQYSLSGQNIPKPYSNSTNINASFGGPLKIPKLLSGNRGQFTVNVGIGRSRVGQQGTLTTMPSDLERSGDFSQSVASNGKPVIIYDPTTGAPFPGNKIDPSRINPIAAALLSYYPMPNLPGQTRNFQLPTTRYNNSNSINARVNQTLSTKNRISGGFGYSGNNSTNPNIFGFTDTGSGRGMNANISYAHNFTSRLISTVNYTFSRNRSLASPFFAYKDNVAARLGIQGVSTDPLNWGPPNLSFTNFAGLSDGAASLARSQTSAVTASLLWVHKTHNLSFGAGYRRQQNNRNSDPNGRGAFAFNGYATSLICERSGGAGYGLRSGGLPAGDAGHRHRALRQPLALLPRLDLQRLHAGRLAPELAAVPDFGLRWDYQTPVTELYNRLVNLQIAPNFTAITPIQPGGAYPAALMNSDPNNFSPRLGFAWRPSAKKSTVIRAGYGLYYNSSVYSGVASQMSQQPPLATVWNLNIQNSPLLSIGDAFTNPANVQYQHADHQHVRDRSQLQDRLRAAMELQHPAEPALLVPDHRGLPGLQGHESGPPVPALGHAAQRPDGALSHRLCLRDLWRQFHLQRRLHPTHAAFSRRIQRERGLRFFEIDRQRRRGRSHPGAGLAELPR